MERISPPKRVANRGEELDHTKEHLFSSPSRQPAVNTYSKEPDPQPLLRPAPEPTPILQPKTYQNS
jgi:hypothetical protein